MTKARTWIALDAARRISASRERDGWWVRAVRRELPGKFLLVVAWALVCSLQVAVFITVLRTATRMVPARGPVPAAMLINSLAPIVAFASGFVAIAVIGIAWSEPDRIARVLEAARVRRGDTLSRQLRADDNGRGRVVDAVKRTRADWLSELDYGSLTAVVRGLNASQTRFRLRNAAIYTLAFAPQLSVWLLSTFIGTPVMYLILIVCIPALIVWCWAPPRRVKRRAKAALMVTACPECAYDLTPLTRVEDGVSPILGPAHCPECGVRWPLVPPSVAISPRASGA